MNMWRGRGRRRSQGNRLFGRNGAGGGPLLIPFDAGGPGRRGPNSMLFIAAKSSEPYRRWRSLPDRPAGTGAVGGTTTYSVRCPERGCMGPYPPTVTEETGLRLRTMGVSSKQDRWRKILAASPIPPPAGEERDSDERTKGVDHLGTS